MRLGGRAGQAQKEKPGDGSHGQPSKNAADSTGQNDQCSMRFSLGRLAPRKMKTIPAAQPRALAGTHSRERRLQGFSGSH